MKREHILKMVMLAMLVAIGVVISPILRVEGMCPMAHLINIVCSVFLGPWYSLLCATLIGIIRMTLMGIPPLALTGAVFGAFLSGVFYRLSGGKILCAVLGEVFGTGVIGAGFLSGDDVHRRARGADMGFLYSVVHRRHADRRLHCVRVPHGAAPQRTACKIPA